MQGKEWTLGGMWTVGTLDVMSGIPKVTGTLGGTTTVAPGSMLEGSGTTGNLFHQGTVSPGNSIGTLNVGGNLTTQPGSTFQIEVNDVGASDRVANTGAEHDDTMLTAAGGVAGAFSNRVEQFPFLDHRLTSLPTSVLLTAFRSQADFQDIAVCPNQLQTARALDAAGAASRPAADFVNLQSLQAFQDSIPSRSATLNLEASLPGASFAATGGAPPGGVAAGGSAGSMAQTGAGSVGAAVEPGATGAWLRGVGLFGNRDSSRCPGQGYVYDLGGATLGADHGFGRNLAFGAAFATGYIGNDTSRSIYTTSFSRRASGDFGSFALSTLVEASGIVWSPWGVAIRPEVGCAHYRLGVQVSRLFAAGAGWTFEPGFDAHRSRELPSVNQTVQAGVRIQW